MSKNRVLHIVAALHLILVCISCETGPDVGLYQFGWTGNIIHFPDSMYTRSLFGRVWPHGQAVEPKTIGSK